MVTGRLAGLHAGVQDGEHLEEQSIIGIEFLQLLDDDVQPSECVIM